MPRIQHNMEEEAERISKFADDLSERTRIGMIRALQTVGRTSAQDWLQGPRPERLGVASGALIRAMMGTHAFNVGEGGSPSTSKKEGWVKAWKAGNKLFGEIGVEVLSKDGFDYSEMWENRGYSAHSIISTRVTRSAQGPRPFLKPAGNQALSAGLLDRDIQTEIDKAKLD